MILVSCPSVMLATATLPSMMPCLSAATPLVALLHVVRCPVDPVTTPTAALASAA